MNFMQSKSFSKNIFKGIGSRLNRMVDNPDRLVNMGIIKKTFYKHISPGKIRIHRLFGKKLSFIRPTELLHGLKEIFIDEIYKQDLPASSFIVDCGANIGLSVIYLKRLFPDAEILAFEPDSENFNLLQKNVQEFNLSNVTLKKEAIWIRDETLNFSANGSTDSKIVLGQSDSTVSVKAVRLKEIITRTVDFLKIDIEGAEYDVIVDIQGALGFVNNLFIEYHGVFGQNTQLNEILSIVVNHGFNYYIKEAASVYKTPFLHNPRPSNPYDIQLNIFCFRL
jgi:FkbM family methyltransferase